MIEAKRNDVCTRPETAQCARSFLFHLLDPVRESASVYSLDDSLSMNSESLSLHDRLLSFYAYGKRRLREKASEGQEDEQGVHRDGLR